jgi:hypothetical protein
MHEGLSEWLVVMTTETEFGLILADFKEERIGGPVRLVAGQAVAIFDGVMDHLLFAHRIMALGAERRSLLNKSETFAPLDGMLRRRLHVAGEALPVGGRLVSAGEIPNGIMTAGGQAGLGSGIGRKEKEQAKGHEDERGFHAANLR